MSHNEPVNELTTSQSETPVSESTVPTSKYRFPNHAQAVNEFTAGRLGKALPQTPVPMNELAVRKCIGLVISELRELARTVTRSNTEAQKLLMECTEMDQAKVEHTFPDTTSLIAAQADSLVDLMYYSYDIAAQHGVDLDRVFDEVHAANMRKKFPDGTFHLEEISPGIFKVIKPEGWVGPDVESLFRQ